MTEFDFEKILEAAANPQATATVEKGITLAQHAESTLKAAEKWMGIIERAINLAEKSGALAPLVRIIAKTQGLNPEDADRPLAGSQAVMPASDAHKAVMQAVNGLSPEEVVGAGQALNQWYQGVMDTKKQQRIAGEGGDGNNQQP